MSTKTKFSFITDFISRIFARKAEEKAFYNWLSAGPFINTGDLDRVTDESPGACVLGTCGCKNLPVKSNERYSIAQRGDSVVILDTVTGKIAPVVSVLVAQFLLPEADKLEYVDPAAYDKQEREGKTVPSSPLNFAVIRNEHNVWGLWDEKADMVAYFGTEDSARKAQGLFINNPPALFAKFLRISYKDFLEFGKPGVQGCSDF